MSWKIRGGYNAEIYKEEGGEHKTICRLWGYGTPEGRRNARLLYAAPDMYALLKSALPFIPASSPKLRTCIQETITRIDRDE